MIRSVTTLAVSLVLTLPLPAAAGCRASGLQEVAERPPELTPRQVLWPALPRYEEELRWLDHNLELLPRDFQPGPKEQVVEGAPTKSGEVVRVRLRRPAKDVAWVLAPDVLSGSHAAGRELAAQRGLGMKYYTHSIPSLPVTPEAADAHFVWMQQDREAGWPMIVGTDLHVSVHEVPLAPDTAVSTATRVRQTADFFVPWVQVPDLVGLSTGEVQQAATSIGLELVSYPNVSGGAPYSASSPPPWTAEVALQFPSAGALAPQGTEVLVVLVDRPEGLERFIPEGSQKRWLGAGAVLLPPEFEPDASNEIVQGMPLDGTDQVAPVWLESAADDGDVEWTEVPPVVGLAASDAAVEVEAKELVIEYYSNTVPPSPFTGSTANYDVQSQTPPATTVVEKGSKVKVVIVIQSGNRVP